MTEHSPITLPRELVQQWIQEARSQDYCSITEYVANRAAQRGADQELEACCEWLGTRLLDGIVNDLRTVRRPKPPGLKEQALELAGPAGTEGAYVTFGPEELALIRRALEALPDDL